MIITSPGTDRKLSKQIRQLLAEQKIRKVMQRLESLHPADVADYLYDFTASERKLIFSLLTDDMAARILCSMDDEMQFEVAQVLGEERLVAVLDSLPSDEAVDILGQYSDERIEQLLEKMEKEEAEDAKVLLAYEEESAGGIMSSEVFYFEDELTVEDAVAKIRRNREDLENLSYLYVTDEAKHLVGVVTTKDIILAEPGTRLRAIMTRDPLVAVRLDDDQEEVARVVAKYDLLAVPVINENDALVGIVHVDDVIDVIQEEATEDMYRFVGMDEDLEVRDSAFQQALSRIRWLLATIMGSLTAGGVIKMLSPVDADLGRAMATFIPAIMGLGGGVAIQSATVVIRGLATGDVEDDDILGLLSKEIRVSVLLGLAIGGLLFVAALVWERALVFAIVVGSALMVQVMIAVSVGLAIPLVLHRVGIDPAIAGGPMTQMTCDVTGLIVYFGFATLAAKHLVL